MALRRSNRLANKLYERYFLEYHKIKLTLTIIGSKCLISFSNENKIEGILKLAKLIESKFAFLLKYEYSFTQNRDIENFCDMLYKKLFEWIKEVSNLTPIYLNPIHLVSLKKTAKKFRHTYEKNRYEQWIFIKSKFKLDDNIMFQIIKYMHYYG
jgi:hypothetical protein